MLLQPFPIDQALTNLQRAPRVMGDAPMIHFLHPDPTATSGGHLYNRQVLQYAAAQGFPLRPVVVDDGADHALSAARGDWLLWDSLLSHRLAAAASGPRHALLVHCLAADNPLLNRRQRAEIATLEQRAARAAHAFIATGAGVAAKLKQRWSGKPVLLAEPGVDPLFAARPAQAGAFTPFDPVQLVTVANLLPAKGHRQLLAVLSQLLHGNWHWHIVGDARVDLACTRRLRRSIAALGWQERVTWHGVLPQAELARLLHRAQVFLCASHYEAYGMALAEAVAAGLPVIATRVGEAERLVRRGIDGYLVEVGDWRGLRRYLESLMAGAALPLMPPPPVRTWQQAGDEFLRACRALLQIPLTTTKGDAC